jgi:DNA-binding NarL/FixJ family response regulator
MQDEWEVVGEAANGQEALQLYKKLKPDAVVMDITMPVMDGLHATTEMVKQNPESKVLILTMHESPSLRHTAEVSGAKGVVIKTKAMRELTPALKTIINGETYFD